MKALRALVLIVAILALSVAPAGAQTSSPSPKNTGAAATPIAPTPEPKPGYCAPWYRCAAFGMGALVVLYLLATAAAFGYQRRGFDRIEHQQGHPEGVPTKK